MRQLRVVFVCTGNICRSPMADVMATAAIAEAGLADRVAVSSCGTHDYHIGKPMDDRAAAELRRRGYSDEHVAAQFAETDVDADLLIAMDRGHRGHLLRAGVDADDVMLLRSLDPDADGDEVDDPYYGADSGFARTHDEIAAALPGLIDEIRARLDTVTE